MMKNGVYFILILLVAELFKILVYANKRTCDVTGLKFCRVDVLSELHIVMMSP